MRNIFNQGRRVFLRRSAIGAAGLAVSQLPKSVFAEPAAFKAINPNIDNMRVVYLKNNSYNSGSTVSTSAVESGLDKMAQTLAQKGNVKDEQQV